MQTPDGAWRVEVIKRGRGRRCRIVHGDNVIDWLTPRAVDQILDEAGVDRSTLVEVRDDLGRTSPGAGAA